MPKLTQEGIRDVFHYNPYTGDFTRIKSKRTDTIGRVAKTLDSHGHIQIKIDGALHLAHRLAWLYVTGSYPDDQIDHVDHVRTNNAWDNLRQTSNMINCQNRGMHCKNTSGETGVSWHKASRKWFVYITANNTRICGGYYIDKADAVAASRALRKQHGFHPNHGY